LGPTGPDPGLYTRTMRPAILRYARETETAGPPASARAPAVTDAAPDPGEAEALRRVQAGDTSAFDLLVRRYMRSAFAVAYRVVGHREDAEDVVQEAFLAALANIASFDTSRRFGPWLHRIVVTRGLNYRKSRTRRSVEPLEESGAMSDAPGPAIDAERAGLRSVVAEALGRLPERQRMVVQLFELDGFSGAEIAEMLGLSPGTVRWYLHEARQALRGMLAHLQESAG
jgi:RNA polymerase sigma-70 factor (ECF subfamily)